MQPSLCLCALGFVALLVISLKREGEREGEREREGRRQGGKEGGREGEIKIGGEVRSGGRSRGKEAALFALKLQLSNHLHRRNPFELQINRNKKVNNLYSTKTGGALQTGL